MTEKNSVLAKFCRATGYKESEVAAHNPKTLTFTTYNGGKYQVRNNKVRTLMGPKYPKEQPSGGTE